MRKLYQPETQNIALSAVVYALSDPNRLEIVRILSQEPELSCNKFELDIAKSTLSHHLKVLREAGVTETRIEGTERKVRLRAEDLEERFPGLLKSISRANPPF